MTTARVATVLVGLAVLAGCSSTASPDERCTERTEWGEYIASHAKVAEGETLTPVQTWSVPSDDHADAHYVAMSFTVTGDDAPMTGVWLVTHMADDESRAQAVLSVNAIANATTDWFDIDGSAAAVAHPNDGTNAAESCIQD